MVYEESLWQAGHLHIAGLDEVGRGALAGPVVAAAVILPAGNPAHLLHALAGVRDSKQMTARARQRLAQVIRQTALAWAIGSTPANAIDRIGIVAATQEAMRGALRGLVPAPNALLLDAFPLPGAPQPQRAIVHGDALSLSIAAASVIAKVYRDARMVEFEATYPGYGFAAHKGYGTPAHRSAIRQLGPCPIHRQTWRLAG